MNRLAIPFFGLLGGLAAYAVCAVAFWYGLLPGVYSVWVLIAFGFVSVAVALVSAAMLMFGLVLTLVEWFERLGSAK